MRKRKNGFGKAFVLFLGILLLSLAVPFGASAATKKGLVKSGGKIYYYQNGKKVKNCWKTVKGHRYYFAKNGAAVQAPKLENKSKNIIGKKIKGNWYGFDQKGRMVKNGIYASFENAEAKLFVFTKSGKADIAKTQRLRKATGYEVNASAARAILGKPKKTKESSSCYKDGGTDLLLTYPNILVSLYRGWDGKEIVLFAEPR